MSSWFISKLGSTPFGGARFEGFREGSFPTNDDLTLSNSLGHVATIVSLPSKLSYVRVPPQPTFLPSYEA